MRVVTKFSTLSVGYKNVVNLFSVRRGPGVVSSGTVLKHCVGDDECIFSAEVYVPRSP